jgi:hypothetical protein
MKHVILSNIVTFTYKLIVIFVIPKPGEISFDHLYIRAEYENWKSNLKSKHHQAAYDIAYYFPV